MLYKRKNENELDLGLFREPTSEYRGFPFWAWNGAVDDGEIVSQVDIFKEMGFGGFHMHVRQGLETEYLGEGFMKSVRDCVERAKELSLYACLYDEDRWPSGAAGGLVTCDKRYRLRYLSMTAAPIEGELATDSEDAYVNGKPLLLGVFKIELCSDGTLSSYRPASDGDTGELRYFYCMTAQGGEARYNYQSYADTMSKEAIDRFIEVTHEAYKREVGDDFGDAVPSIFFDEPQCVHVELLPSGASRADACTHWTPKLPEIYAERYGSDLLPRLPEIFYVMKDGSDKVTKYRFYTLSGDLFSSAFCDNIGEWCERNGIACTGHLRAEQALYEMMAYGGGDAMRGYRKMHIPGIDMLWDELEITTAKQCQSAVRQYGREGMLSELYGVTGWDFDFSDHKLQGDCQAAFGVTVRVPHLCWQTMKGEGKRDYPASIFYQSPWYKEYKLVEDHFARLNTALTRGKPIVRVAVLHPVDTYKMYMGSIAESPWAREMDERFHGLAKLLVDSTVDFDYIAESLLEELCPVGGNPLAVGEMRYDAVILLDCETLRPHTLKTLAEFSRSGGKLIAIGKKPHLCDAIHSEAAVKLGTEAVNIEFSRSELCRELAPLRDVRLTDGDGVELSGFTYTMRRDGESRWLFICHTVRKGIRGVSEAQDVRIVLDGTFRAEIYDTQNGTVIPTECSWKNGCTVIKATLYQCDSLLLRLYDGEGKAATVSGKSVLDTVKTVESEVCYRVEEPNALLLDMASYSLDGEPLNPTEEIMRLDIRVRERLGYDVRTVKFPQPYYLGNVPEEHSLRLVYNISSDVSDVSCRLAIEDAAKLKVTFNGQEVSNTPVGYYVDRHIDVLELPSLQKGENILTVDMPFGLRTDIEPAYLLGDFGVGLRGRTAVITKRPETLCFGDVTGQGYPFYGGNLIYESFIETEGECDLEIETSYFGGACVKVSLDGEGEGIIAYPPYRYRFENVSAGKHKITYLLYGNRSNTFNSLHNMESHMTEKLPYNGPAFWRAPENKFIYEYQLKPFGILKSPQIRIYRK